MTLLKIAQMGHPVLLRPAAPVADVADRDCQRLVDDMIETMLDAPAVGLAAPQVYRSQRVIVVLPLAEREAADAVPPLVLINPELAPLGEKSELGLEGCLSIPEIRGLVPRRRRVRYRGRDRDGRPIAGVAEGFFARILQHEVDHLDGVLFPMRMMDLRHLATTSEVPHLMARLSPAAEEQR